jgi:hypothetical protein
MTMNETFSLKSRREGGRECHTSSTCCCFVRSLSVVEQTLETLCQTNLETENHFHIFQMSHKSFTPWSKQNEGRRNEKGLLFKFSLDYILTNIKLISNSA